MYPTDIAEELKNYIKEHFGADTIRYFCEGVSLVKLLETNEYTDYINFMSNLVDSAYLGSSHTPTKVNKYRLEEFIRILLED